MKAQFSFMLVVKSYHRAHVSLAGNNNKAINSVFIYFHVVPNLGKL